MRTTRLGRTGIEVSALCFGTMSFGGDADPAESAALYAACREAGVNFFDCANVYQDGLAEEILGRLIAPERDEIVLTTKAGQQPGGLSPRALRLELEASLRRLNTDRVEVFFCHRFDPDADLEASLRALEDLRREGKFLHLGVSNWAAWQIASALGIEALRGWAPIDVLQPMYSLVKRQAEVEILPLALADGLAVISYSPLGGGLLTGKYAAGGSGRIEVNPMYARRYDVDWMREAGAGLKALADEAGVHPATLAVAWVAAHPAITCPIIGARSAAQLQPSLAAADFALDAALKARIDALSRRPPPATDRLEEQEAQG